MKSDPHSCERNLCNCAKEAWKKNQDLINGLWFLDVALKMLVRCSNQLSYEAIFVGSRSVVVSYVPVIEKGEWFSLAHILLCHWCRFWGFTGIRLGTTPFSVTYLSAWIDDIIIRQHGMEFHVYADDSQTFVSLDSSSCCLSAEDSRIQACLLDISGCR